MKLSDRCRFLGCEWYLFCLLSCDFYFLCLVIFKHELTSSRMDVSYALACEGGLMDYPRLRVIFMLISWFGFKRHPNKVGIIWTLTPSLPSILPFLKSLSLLATVNCPQHHPSIYILVFCCIWLAWPSTGSVVFLFIFSLNMTDAITE